MTDTEILQKMGLKEAELTDLLQKLNTFINTLNPAQREAFLDSFRTTEKAAHDFGDDVTPERLKAFLEKRTPPNGTVCILGKHHRHRPESENRAD
jgi:hypothetical protein